jgi:hypothetical protein
MYNKGRRCAYQGEDVSNASLLNRNAKEIREKYVPRTLKRQEELAKEYSTSVGVIQSIIYNRGYLNA